MKWINSATLSSTSILLYLAIVSCNKSDKYSKPLTPEKELSTFSIDSNFSVQIFASEPMVEEPIDMVIDEMGNIYVIEMPDFADDSEDGTGRNRIKVLRDTDSDGKIDDYIVFADSIKEATSLQPWKGGILVTAAPYIYYMKDTDGDFKTDIKEILFEGFFQKNQEAQITSLKFSVDNWMYASNHGQAGKVRFNRQPDEEILAMQGADFRFRLDKNQFQRETAAGQFGQAFDKWGHRFITQNTIHIQEMVIPWRYLHRHNYLPTTKGMLNISDHDLRMYQISDPPYWRVERSNRRQAKYDEQGLNRTEYIDNHFTAASGGTHYGGVLFPEEYHGNIFTGDVMGNLVHRDVLEIEPGQPCFTAKRAPTEEKKEFLASTDPWFRPTNFTIGPDGALYVIDMYRQHIEAPFSIPDDLKEDMNYLNGEDLGRIFRIVPKGFSGPVIPEEVKMQKSSDDYVGWLTNPNQWYRLHAQRLILESQDQSVIPAVRMLFENDEDPVTRLHALYVLEGLGELDMELIKEALVDPSPGLKEHALILAEQYTELIPYIIALKNNQSERVVMQVALSLGEFSSAKIFAALGEILVNHYYNPLMRLSVLSSEAGSSIGIINYLSSNSFFQEPDSAKTELVNQMGYIFGARGNKNEIKSFLNIANHFSYELRKSTLDGISEGLSKSKIKISDDMKKKMEIISDNQR